MWDSFSFLFEAWVFFFLRKAVNNFPIVFVPNLVSWYSVNTTISLKIRDGHWLKKMDLRDISARTEVCKDLHNTVITNNFIDYLFLVARIENEDYY